MRPVEKGKGKAMELWDVYDENGNKTGRVHTRGKPMAPGDCHLGAIIVVVNRSREILCTLRSPEKKLYPGIWENTGGGVLAGEDSLTAAVRELKEETGISAKPEELILLYRVRVTEPDGGGSINDIYGLRREMDAKDVVLQPGETVDAKWIPYEEWEQKARTAEILSPAGPNDEEFFTILQNYIKGA